MVCVSRIDWRVGLRCKPKLRSDPLRCQEWVILGVERNGFAGISDQGGVLRISLDNGGVILRPAGQWMTA